jgi:hypothetical protein
MKKLQVSRTWFVVALMAAILLMQLVARLAPLQAELYWQSVLPTPDNPHFVRASDGGRVYCGAQQSTVWLNVPVGFTTEGGAEIHCDPSASLFRWNNTEDAWDDRGYLVGIYPPVSIVKPLRLVFELDPTRTEDICQTCVVGAYYQRQGANWQDLHTEYDVSTKRARVDVAEVLPSSGYPAYEDRFVIALFVRSMPQRPSPSSTTKPSSVPTSTSTPDATSTRIPRPSPTLTLQPSATYTSTPAPSPTQTLKPSPTDTPKPSLTYTSTPAPSPTQTLRPSPTDTPKPSLTYTATSSLVPTLAPEGPESESFPWWVVLLIFVVGGVVLSSLLRKRTKKRNTSS